VRGLYIENFTQGPFSIFPILQELRKNPQATGVSILPSLETASIYKYAIPRHGSLHPEVGVEGSSEGCDSKKGKQTRQQFETPGLLYLALAISAEAAVYRRSHDVPKAVITSQ
jgi:hypothetical protein